MPPTTNPWSQNPIDSFVFKRLEENGFKPSAPADRYALLRRATFDLTGLPPTPREIEAFIEDQSPQAYANAIERLLASSAYGERWARHWLDAARYADTGGPESDLLMREAWRYRDYVIRAFNANKPFDRFVMEQVAGDELWPDDPDAITATAFYSVGPVLEESALVDDQLEYDFLTDAADTTGEVFLGLTFACARCHDHKYDPLTQKDYFAMQAVFAGSDRVYPAKVRETRIKRINGLLAEGPLPAELADDPRCALPSDTQFPMRLVQRQTPYPVRRLHRGELSKPMESVKPQVPVALQDAGHAETWEETSEGRRTRLARWLTSKDNPLTARVFVNRIWAWHFGHGLVRTPNDFGAQGDPPTHPKLLDWLARDFVEHGWDIKRLHKLIMLSGTYRQSSVGTDPRAMELDPQNKSLWHFPRQRLQAEIIRDSILACSGSLNPDPFGPPVQPPLTADERTGLFGDDKWVATQDASEHSRRSVYLFVRRTFLFPMLDSFDPPQVMTSCPQRSQTVLPTQALALLNGPITAGESRVFAKSLVRGHGLDPKKIVGRAWLVALGRPVTPTEEADALGFLHHRITALPAASGSDASASSSLETAVAELCLALFNANEFIYID